MATGLINNGDYAIEDDSNGNLIIDDPAGDNIFLLNSVKQLNFDDPTAWENANSGLTYPTDTNDYHVFRDSNFTPEYESTGTFTLKLEGAGRTDIHYEPGGGTGNTLVHGIDEGTTNVPFLLGKGPDLDTMLSNNDTMLSVVPDTNEIGRGTPTPSYDFDMNSGNIGNVVQVGKRDNDQQLIAFANNGDIVANVDNGSGSAQEVLRIPDGGASDVDVQFSNRGVDFGGGLLKNSNDSVGNDNMTANPETDTEDGHINYVASDGNVYDIPFYSP